MERRAEKIIHRGRIVGLRETGMSADDIAEHVGVHRSTVFKWLNMWEEEGDLRDHHRQGARSKKEDDSRARTEPKRIYGRPPILQCCRGQKKIRNRHIYRNHMQEVKGNGISPQITSSKAKTNREAEAVSA